MRPTPRAGKPAQLLRTGISGSAGAPTFDTTKRLTAPQMRVLRMTRDDVVLTIGGIDGRKVRKDVIYRLNDMGLLKYKVPSTLFMHSEWVLTDKAKDLLSRD